MSTNPTLNVIRTTLVQLYYLVRGKISYQNTGRNLLRFFETTGGIVKLALEGLYNLPRPPYRGRLLIAQAAVVGWSSIPLVTVTLGFLGMITVLELKFQLSRLMHNVSLVPGISALLFFRAFGPTVVATMVAAKVGAGFTSEIGGMKTTDQIDALELLGVNPVHYLLVPRLAACVTMQVALSIVGVFAAFMSGFLVSIFTSNFQLYLGIVNDFVGWPDFINLIMKSLAMGWVVPVTSCFYGFRAQGGAQGVGEAATKAVVTSILLIIMIDFTISAIADRLVSAVM